MRLIISEKRSFKSAPFIVASIRGTLRSDSPGCTQMTIVVVTRPCRCGRDGLWSLNVYDDDDDAGRCFGA